MKTKKIHYCYKITNLNPTDKRLYYIGVRSTLKSNPELDTNYRSSSNTLNKIIEKNGYANFKKEILSIWETRKLAVQEEIRLHNLFDVSRNPLFYNKAKQTSTGFDTSNRLAVIDIRDNTTKQVTIDEFNKYSFYKAVAKDFISVLDVRDNTTKRVSSEEFNKHDFYVSLTKNRVSVLDKRTGLTKSVDKEEFLNDDMLVSCIKNKVTVLDTRDNKRKLVPKVDYEKFDYFISIKSSHFKIYNHNNDLEFEICGNFVNFCKLHGLPGAFIHSYRNNGERLYSKPRALLYVKDKYKQYKDWYALKFD